MKCDMCGWREAKVVVYLIGTEREVKNKLFLCSACSREVSVSWVVSPDSQKGSLSTRISPLEEKESCPFCGWQWEEFLESGLFGCPHCYNSYFPDIKNWLLENQLGTHHRGKNPANWRKKNKIRNAILRLSRDLEKCIEEENYEKAGQLKKIMEKLNAHLK